MKAFVYVQLRYNIPGDCQNVEMVNVKLTTTQGNVYKSGFNPFTAMVLIKNDQ